MTVQISNFQSSDIEKGTFVTIHADVIRIGNLFKIIPDKSIPKMEKKQLIRGVKAVLPLEIKPISDMEPVNGPVDTAYGVEDNKSDSDDELLNPKKKPKKQDEDSPQQ